MQKHGGNFEIKSGTCSLVSDKIYLPFQNNISMGIIKTEFIHFDWVDLENPNISELSELVQPYGISLNLLEDALQVGHLPKIEKVGELNFLILRAFSAEKEEKLSEIASLTNKIGFFFNDNLLLTIHQKKFSFLTSISGDFPNPEVIVLKIIQKMLETYHQPANWLSEEMDKFERGIFLNRSKKFSVDRLYYDKAKARACKKLMLLTQLVLNQLQVKPSNLTQLQDLKETAASLVLQFDDFLDEANSLLTIHLASNSQKTNEVMKLLTVFSAFFLPLTFIVGVYGMNFEFMPEIHWEFGYFLTWGIMAGVSVLIFFWFRKKNII